MAGRQLVEHGLERTSGLVAHHDDLVLPNGMEPAVDLEVALQDQVVVVVVAVVRRSSEHVVWFGTTL